MAGSVFSENWFRVAGLKPRLRPHARLYRQQFRGETWYVMQDDQTGRYHRLSPAANHMIGLMDGRRSMAQIWEAATTWAGAAAEPPTQDEAIRLLAQLHRADLMAGDMPQDIGELAFRARNQASRALMQRVRNPLALRLPLWDPDRFLTATMPLVRWMFGWVGVVLWLCVVGAGATLAALNWGELTTGLNDRVFLAENLLLLLLVYPVIKALHELGHGYSVKRWGGEVHETGLMFLVLVPMPYVDASAAAAFVSKWQRAVVGGAGILVELFVAGVAMIVWASVEPGIVRAAAFNAALIGGLSTLLFNGNPLLRFDGYYVMSDLLEIPNLASRANRHFFYVLKRYAFGMREQVSPATASGERGWFMFYAVASFCYRLSVVIGIAVFVAHQFFFLGVLLALWAVGSAFVFPVIRGVWWLAEAPELRGRRRRAIAMSTVFAGGFLVFLMAIPLPYATNAIGVIQPREAAELNITGSGFITELDGQGNVQAGARVLALADEELEARRDLILAQRAELSLKLDREIGADPAQVAILREQIAHAGAALSRIDEQIDGLSLVASRDGQLVVPRQQDLAGRYVERGMRLGYILAPGDPLIRVAVPQARADLVRRRLHDVEVLLPGDHGEVLPALVVQQTPKATRQLPSAALGARAGGKIALDPGDGSGRRALDPHFLFELEAPLPLQDIVLGERVYVRFDHGAEPLAFRMARNLRQLFLRQFDV